MVMMVLWGLVYCGGRQTGCVWHPQDGKAWRPWQSAKPLLERSQKDTSSCKAALCALLPFVPCWPGGKPDVVGFSRCSCLD